jgi:hypothetical protein
MLSCRATPADGFFALTSCISGEASGATKVLSCRLLRCLLALGCSAMFSEDVGRGLRLALRVFAAGVLLVVAGENMANMALFGGLEVVRPVLLIARG